MSYQTLIPRLAILLVLLSACVPAEQQQDPAVSELEAEVIGSGPDLVLVPGLSGSPLPWRDTAQRLARTRRVHVVRIPGLGVGPDGDPPHSISELADALASYLRKHARRPATVAGHSAGGVATLVLALRQPHLLDKVVIVDALPFMSANRGVDAVDDALVAAAGSERAAIMSESTDAFYGRLATQSLNSMRDGTMAAQIASESARSNRSCYAEFVFDLMTLDIRPTVRRISVPITVIFADQAPLGAPPGLMARRYSAQYAGTRAELLEVRNSRHYVMLDQPRDFALALDKALGPAHGSH